MCYIKGIRFGLHFLSRLFTNIQKVKRNMDFVIGARKLMENHSNSSAEEEEIILKSSNLVVIMAAMLCALICLLGLFSMVRCALRCRGRTRPFVLRSTHRIFFPLVDRGLDKAALQALPVVEYCKEEICGADCAICLTEFAEGEKVRPLPNCGHCFHVSCIDTWFVAHSSCPTCRGVISSVATQSEGNADSSAASVSTTLRGIACPLQYWNRNMLDPTIDRYLP